MKHVSNLNRDIDFKELEYPCESPLGKDTYITYAQGINRPNKKGVTDSWFVNILVVNNGKKIKEDALHDYEVMLYLIENVEQKNLIEQLLYFHESIGSIRELKGYYYKRSEESKKDIFPKKYVLDNINEKFNYNFTLIKYFSFLYYAMISEDNKLWENPRTGYKDKVPYGHLIKLFGYFLAMKKINTDNVFWNNTTLEQRVRIINGFPNQRDGILDTHYNVKESNWKKLGYKSIYDNPKDAKPFLEKELYKYFEEVENEDS